MPAAREWITRPAGDRRSLEAQGWRYHKYARDTGHQRAHKPSRPPRDLVIMWRPMPAADAEAA